MKICFTFVFLFSLIVPLKATCFVNAGVSRFQQSEAKKVKDDKPKSKSTPNSPNTMREFTPFQHRAILALKGLLNETLVLANYKLRIKAQILIADSLWIHDEALSKKTFVDILKTIDELNIPADQRFNQFNNHLSVSPHFQLRQELLSTLATRDYNLANTLRDSIENKIENSDKVDIQTTEKEKAVIELFLAKSLAKSNPQQAAQIIRRSFVSGINPILVAILIEMRQENPTLANSLFLEALPFAYSKFGGLSETIGPLAGYIMPGEEAILFGNELPKKPGQEEIIRNFLSFTNEIILSQIVIESNGSKALNKTTAQQDYILLQVITPMFMRYMPNAYPNLDVRKSQLSSYIPQRQAEAIETAIARRDDYENTLQNAESTGNMRQKELLYSQAAMQAVRSNESDKALIISDKISDKKEREMVVSLIHYQTALKLLNNDKFLDAVKHAREISFMPQRVEIYRLLIEHFLSKGDIQRTEETLLDIENWLEKAPDELKKAHGLLTMAGMAAKYKPVRGFEATKRMVKCINSIDFTESKNSLVSKSEVPTTLEMLDFSKVFSILARSDFERALLIAKSIQKEEASILAQVIVHRTVLDSHPVSIK